MVKPLDRRAFLTRGSMAVGAAGVLVAVPGITDGLVATESEAPTAVSTVGGEVPAMAEPIVAHVRDLATGEIGIFSGTREVVFRDPDLAVRLFHATR